MRQMADPKYWSKAEEIFLLGFRLLVGGFLVWGVWDNVISSDRMAEFSRFLASQGFVYPDLLAPVSVYAQLVCGIGILLGLMTRWLGVVCAVNFLVALIMVDAQGGFRQAFPAAMLIMFGLYVASRGAGRYSIDAALWKTPE